MASQARKVFGTYHSNCLCGSSIGLQLHAEFTFTGSLISIIFKIN